jgi:Ca2+-binding EF-hand superfamily protein/diadenosine tetraphosphatase ApaH/serine/threonine PP2A family protein phosphatase
MLYPTRVFLNRGNHEDLSLNTSKNFEPNFKKDVHLKFGRFGTTIFEQAQRLFRRLPIATVIENNVGYKLFVCHGGISHRLDLEYLTNNLNRFKFAAVTIRGNEEDRTKKKSAEQFTDLLWSDPAKRNLGCEPNNHRGIGWLFGSDVSQNFCKKYGFDAIIRSHEVRADGFSQDHQYCYTVFSSSYYCGGTNKAAVLLLDANEKRLIPHQFESRLDDMSEFNKNRNQLISNFKAYLMHEVEKLMAKFLEADPNETGLLSLNIWSQIISEHVANNLNTYVEPRHLITLKDYLCPCDELNQTAQYELMFGNKREYNQADEEIYELLDHIFNLIDLNQDGSISDSEAHTAIEKINAVTGKNYSANFIAQMDLNEDGYVDIDEFKKGFSKAFNLKI